MRWRTTTMAAAQSISRPGEVRAMRPSAVRSRNPPEAAVTTATAAERQREEVGHPRPHAAHVRPSYRPRTPTRCTSTAHRRQLENRPVEHGIVAELPEAHQPGRDARQRERSTARRWDGACAAANATAAELPCHCVVHSRPSSEVSMTKRPREIRRVRAEGHRQAVDGRTEPRSIVTTSAPVCAPPSQRVSGLPSSASGSGRR